MAEEKTEVDVLCEKLFMNKKHSANFVDEAELQRAMDFAEDYKKFLNDNKTEREVAKFVVAEAEKKGENTQVEELNKEIAEEEQETQGSETVIKREQMATPTSTSGGSDQPSNTTVRKKKKVGRNDPCPCGSGKKYKKCCGKDE